MKGYITRNNIQLHGKCMYNKELCSNDTDFYTFDNIKDINDLFFFSYKDNNGFHWFFDIRSFDKLITMNQENPYNREIIPDNIKENANKLIDKLKKNNKYESLDIEIKMNKKQSIKQKTVDIFSKIEQFGYECHFEWFLKLNIYNLKKLYRTLEDIWNYRLQLTQENKNNICPPNGLIYNIPLSTILSYTNIYDLQDIILNELNKINNAIDDSNKKLGYMYFLIGLSEVSKDCFMAHQWLWNIYGF